MRAGAQQLERRLVADLDARAGDQRVLAAQVGALFALGVVEVAAGLAHRIVVAVHLREGLLADVAVAFLVEARPLIGVVRLRRLEPQRREQRGAALDAQPCLLDRLAILFLRGFPLGAPKSLRHPHEIVALGLCDEPGERQQLAPLLLGEAREVRAIRLDGPQNPHAGAQLVIGNIHGSSLHPTIVPNSAPTP